MTAAKVSKEALVAAALEVLASDGVRGLTVRAVSQRAGCSTTGIYTHFGGKQGLLDDMYIDGYALLDASTPPPRSADPGRDIVEGLVLYRRFAAEHPALYLLMFASRAQGYVPSPAAGDAANTSLAIFGETVARAVEAGVVDADPAEAAWHLWGAAHGYVMLELTGLEMAEGAGEAVVREGIGRMLRGYAAA